VKLLGEIAHIAAGQGAPQGDASYSEIGVPFIKAGNLYDLVNNNIDELSVQKVSEETAKKYKLKLFPKGTVVFAKSGMSCMKGYVYELHNPCYVVNHLACITLKNDLPRFVKYFFDKNPPNALVKDSAYPSISLSDIASIQIPLPPLHIQQKIAHILDHTNAIIEKRKTQIEKLNLLVKSQFIEMFGDTMTNSMGWEVSKLGNLSSLITKGASPNWQGFGYTPDSTQTLFVTSENVREGYVDLESPKYIVDAFNEKQRRSILHKGDFLINIVGASIGRAAQYTLDAKANINQAVALVRLASSLTNERYLLHYLNSQKALEMYASMQVAVARANLSLQNISDLEIILPPIELQNSFAEFVRAVDKSKFELLQGLDKLELLYKSLMQKCFNGELYS